MKLLSLVCIMLLLSSCVYSKNNEIITISQIRDGGNGHYYTVIGKDKKYR